MKYSKPNDFSLSQLYFSSVLWNHFGLIENLRICHDAVGKKKKRTDVFPVRYLFSDFWDQHLILYWNPSPQIFNSRKCIHQVSYYSWSCLINQCWIIQARICFSNNRLIKIYSITLSLQILNLLWVYDHLI